MSTWRELPTEDIDIDHHTKEINLLINSDSSGNNYVTLTWIQVEDIYENISEYRKSELD